MDSLLVFANETLRGIVGWSTEVRKSVCEAAFEVGRDADWGGTKWEGAPAGGGPVGGGLGLRAPEGD